MIELSKLEKQVLTKYALTCGPVKESLSKEELDALGLLQARGFVHTVKDHITDRGHSHSIVDLKIPISQIFEAHPNFEKAFEGTLVNVRKGFKTKEAIDRVMYYRTKSWIDNDLFNEDNSYRDFRDQKETAKIQTEIMLAMVDDPQIQLSQIFNMAGFPGLSAMVRTREDFKSYIKQALALYQ